MVNAAKETSLAALTATKRDLAEFVTVLKNDTEAAVTGATASLRTLLVRRISVLCKAAQYNCDTNLFPFRVRICSIILFIYTECFICHVNCYHSRQYII